MLSKRKIAIALTLVGGLALMVSSFAGAESNNSSIEDNRGYSIKIERGSHGKNMQLEIGPAGRATIRGTLVSVGSDSLVLKSWGGNWTIRVSSSTEILPKVVATSSPVGLAAFTAGDFVGVNGRVVTDQNWTVDAKVVKDWSIRRVIEETRKEIKKIEKQEKKEERGERGQNREGIASNVSSTSFGLTIDQTLYTVNISSSTRIVNRDFFNIGFTDIRNGDRVRVFGSASGTIVTAEVVRDVSLPL